MTNKFYKQNYNYIYVYTKFEYKSIFNIQII